MSEQKTKVVIAGGGTAGWLAAAALSQQLGSAVEVTLVESAEIGTVGVGEATIPPMKTFHRLLRIDEQEFMRTTHATFKLGIQFENWRVEGEKYFHSFGTTGRDTLVSEFIHFWLRGRDMGIAKDFGDYCVEFKAALENKCSTQGDTKVNHAFHLDAGLYAKYLRTFAERHGATQVEGNIAEVLQDNNSGYITGLRMASGDIVSGDLFVDCTGFRGLLIEQTLHAGYESWEHWLPCNRAVAVQTASVRDPVPYTRSIAHHAGWRWQIPLQHRVGNGTVFCNRYMSEDEAIAKLLADIQGDVITEPRVIQFQTGRRRKNWVKNCVAMGLSSGFLEPLESTSIHLIMTSIMRLLQLFPGKDIQQATIDEYNMQAAIEFELIRDFIILHYKATEREDSKFWRYCKRMDIPESLAHRIDLFRETGKSYQKEGELFRLDSWTQVMLGQGIYPKRYHPMVDSMQAQELERLLTTIAGNVDAVVDRMPVHGQFLAEYCAI